MKAQDIAKFIRSNQLVVIWFCVTLSFFIAQHAGFSWDFAVHSMNAQYMLGHGNFFEWLRPPLASSIMAAFNFLGSRLAEYAYIIAVSFLYLYSSLKFAKKFQLDPKYYYIFSLSAFGILFAFSVGTELLSLALLQLSLAYLHEKRSGIYFGLAIMARYSNLPYLLLVFFQKNTRKIYTTFLFAFALAVPWLAYNYLMTGNPLTSFLDNYLLNVRFRSVLIQPVSLVDIGLAVNIVLPFFLLGAFKKGKNTPLMFSMLALTALIYALTPLKEARYLFPAIIPLAYFSARSIEKNDRVIAIFAAASIILVLLLSPMYALEGGGLYKNLASRDNCAVISNVWVPFNYYGKPAEPLVYANIPLGNETILVKTNVEKKISEGYRVIIFKTVRDPFAGYNISVMEDNDAYVILGDPALCKQPLAESMTFVEKLQSLSQNLECDFFSCTLNQQMVTL